jgi:hypothetical protein
LRIDEGLIGRRFFFTRKLMMGLRGKTFLPPYMVV